MSLIDFYCLLYQSFVVKEQYMLCFVENSIERGSVAEVDIRPRVVMHHGSCPLCRYGISPNLN